MSEFPRPAELVARYLAQRKLPTTAPALQLLTTGYTKGRDFLRYYQDAAVRAALEKIITDRAAGKAPRILLSLATGSGKTRIAAVLLKLLFDAGMFGRALFVCDRKELRNNGEGDFLALFGTDAATVNTRNPQKNAKVIIATYQTLDHDFQARQRTPKNTIQNFFTKHYPKNYFNVIVIDECHRSAWGKNWSEFLKANDAAIHIGLTATPRELKLPKPTMRRPKSKLTTTACGSRTI